MTWTKLSDDFSDDCWSLSDQAFRTHVEGLVWNNRKLLDCRLPKDDVRRFAKHPEAVAELLSVGWWSEDGDAYQIRHHATYMRSKKAVLAQQAANEKNGKKGGRPKREQASDLQQKTHSVTESVSESGTERDRPGQDRPVRAAGSETTSPVLGDDGWPVDEPHSFPTPTGPQTEPPTDDRPQCADCARHLGKSEIPAGVCLPCQRIRERTHRAAS